MSTKRRLARPGISDNDFMTVTCTPDATRVEFFEHAHEAQDAARENLHPTTTTYVGQILLQGQHALRGSSKYIAICVEVDDELRRALMAHAKLRGRADYARYFEGLLGADLAEIRSEYRRANDAEVTQPVAKVDPCTRCGGPNSPTAPRNLCSLCRSELSGHGL